jgi:GT2 family glycosyltransferase
MAERIPITVVIPTWRRTDQLLPTLGKLLECDPLPDEILVHVDAGDRESASAMREAYGDSVGIIESVSTQGPGGGRNLLITKARNPYFASFDDDSWPLHRDYFMRACRLLDSLPNAAVVTATILYGNDDGSEESVATDDSTRGVSSFEGCGHVGRCQAFRGIAGYLPLRHAYGMEEADVALQLMDRGWEIRKTGILRVFHDTELSHHASRMLNAAQITNTALKAYLRYPASYWPYGILQVLNRVKYSLQSGRYRGIVSGLVSIPGQCRHYRANRSALKFSTISLARSLPPN